MNDVFQTMLSAYDLSSSQSKRNATFEINQQIILSGLYNGGFFDKAAFYGGTCLRIFHGLGRFSEDMDFSLLSPDEGFDFAQYFQPIIDEFAYSGRSVTITRKEKKNFSRVESAFLKDDTEVYDIQFSTEKSIKIKIEVDTNPPLKFSTENKLLLQPRSFYTRCMTLPCLFVGKMHALVFRGWKNRVKGRDWYDFEWYVKNGVPLDFAHLQERIRQFSGEDMDRDDFLHLLRSRLAQVNISHVKDDVRPFVRDPHDLDLWSNDYFLELLKMISWS